MPAADDQELWTCALSIEEEHHREAWLYATMCIQDLVAEGDHDGAQKWREIRSRILLLRRGSKGRRQ
jgi:hypothetical protein